MERTCVCVHARVRTCWGFVYHSTHRCLKNQKPMSQNPERRAAAQPHCQRNISTTERVSKEGKSRRKTGEKDKEIRREGVEKSQRSIMNVQTETGSIACHYTAGFYYGAPAGGQSSSPSDSPSAPLSLTPPSRSHLCKDGSLPDYAPCGCNDKACACVCVRGCARVCTHLITHPSPETVPHSARVFFFCPPKTSLAAACNKNTVHPENEPARLSLASPSSLSF